MSDMPEIDVVIVTQDVAVMAECPDCGSEMRYGFDCFETTALWYGEESITCPSCGEEYRIASVERDV